MQEENRQVVRLASLTIIEERATGNEKKDKHATALSKQALIPDNGPGLPSAFNPKGTQILRFLIFKIVLNESIHAATAGTTPEALTQFGKIFDGSGCNHLNITFFGVPNPTAQLKFTGFAMHEPPKAYALHASLNEEMENHDSTNASLSDAAKPRNGHRMLVHRSV